MADDNWITPAEAENFVASHIGVGGLLFHQARDHLLSWIAQDQLRTMALEVTRWQDEPPPPAPPPPPPSEPNDDDPDAPKAAYRLNGAFRLLNSWELPLAKCQVADYAMSAKDWEIAAAAGAGDGSLWTTSELTHRLIEERHPNARVTYAGIRMSKTDIERRIAVAGWQAPAATSEKPAATDDGPQSPSNPPVTQSPKSRPIAHDHPYAAARVALALMSLPESERARLNGPSIGREMQQHYAARHAENRVPHDDNLDEYGSAVLEALREHWRNS